MEHILKSLVDKERVENITSFQQLVSLTNYSNYMFSVLSNMEWQVITHNPSIIAVLIIFQSVASKQTVHTTKEDLEFTHWLEQMEVKAKNWLVVST